MATTVSSPRPAESTASTSTFHKSATFRRSSNTKRGSVSEVLKDGAYFTRNESEQEFPHALKSDMGTWLKKLESQFTITPQRMRM